MKKLFIYRVSSEDSLLKTVVTKEYIEIGVEDIKWVWEKRRCNWDGHNFYYYGYVPYINDEIKHIYVISDNGKFMDSITSQEDGSYRLYPKYYDTFNLVASVLEKYTIS